MALVQLFLWLRYPITLWITLLLLSSFFLCPVLPEVIYRVDPLALLAATLRTYQRAGCDSEHLSLSCPRGTSISIELAQYGRAGDSMDNNLCPSTSDDTTTLLDGVIHSGAEIEVKPPESCMWPNAIQYSLLQTVVEACQKKRHCKFTATPKSIAGDPCPGIRKFVEIAYKCRPYEFRSKVACENDVIQLVCNPYSRIAIYSASFGRTEYESIQCSQPQGVKEETCLVSYATETVMQICHGRRRCTLSADSSTFGKPCRPDSRMYLKVVYTCIPRKVLKDRFDTPEPDEPQQTDLDIDQDDLYDEDQFYKESEAIPPAPKLQGGFSNPGHSSDFESGVLSSSVKPPLLSRNNNGLDVDEDFSKKFLIPKFENGDIFGRDRRDEGSSNENSDSTEHKKKFFIKNRKISKKLNDTSEIFNTSVKCYPDDGKNGEEEVEVIGFIAEWSEAYLFLSQNQEKFYLYLVISVAAGVLLCLILVIGRLVVQKRRAQSETKFQQSNTGETQLPNGFSDDISEIDADIDLTTPLPVPSVSRNDNYMTYAPSPSPYGSLGPSNVSHTSTTMLVPSSGLMVSGGVPVGMGVSSIGSASGHHHQQQQSQQASHQQQQQQHQQHPQQQSSQHQHLQQQSSIQQHPPPTMLGASGSAAAALMGPPVSGTMGTLIPISSVSHHTTTPSYIAGSIMVGHHGTLRRSMIPAGGMVAAAVSPSPSPSPMGIVTYDGTIPRSLSRGITDNSQYYYG